MERSISEVARLAGVTTRTLRHYDAIGLLHPVRVSANGYRWYGRTELLRLQRILLLRELGVPLPHIRAVLDGDSDELAALRRHRQDLQAERDRLDGVLATIDRTIADLQGDADLEDEEFFAGLRRGRDALLTELVARYGTRVEEHFAGAEATTGGWSREDYERAAEQGRDLLRRLSRHRAAGDAPDAGVVLDLVAEHHAAVCLHWPADAAAYAALADVLLTDPAQRAVVAEVDPQLPEWLAAGMRAYAVARLGPASPSPEDLRR